MVSFALHGVGVSGGIAIGRAQLVSHATLEVAHYTIPEAKVDAEIARFSNAVKEVQQELEGLHAAMTSGDVPGEFGAFLDVHWMILNDATLSEAPKQIGQRATLQRGVGAHPADWACWSTSSTRSRIRTCASASRTSCRWASVC